MLPDDDILDQVPEPEEEDLRGPWATEYDRRVELLKRLKWKWVPPVERGRKAALVFTGPRDALEMLQVLSVQLMGDVLFMAVGNKRLSKLQITWGDYVIPYPVKQGQNRLVFDKSGGYLRNGVES
jgi:hypothetical protein